jgi:hypothetical protein
VIPPRAAAQIAERAGLAAWAPPSPTAKTPDAPTATDNGETKRLLHLLLTIYTVDTRYASRISPSFRMYKFSRSSFPAFLSCQCTRGSFRCIPYASSFFLHTAIAIAITAITTKGHRISRSTPTCLTRCLLRPTNGSLDAPITLADPHALVVPCPHLAYGCTHFPRAGTRKSTRDRAESSGDRRGARAAARGRRAHGGGIG